MIDLETQLRELQSHTKPSPEVLKRILKSLPAPVQQRRRWPWLLAALPAFAALFFAFRSQPPVVPEPVANATQESTPVVFEDDVDDLDQQLADLDDDIFADLGEEDADLDLF